MRVDKHTDPTKYDCLPYGTLWRVLETDKQYIQIDENERRPQWLRVEDVFGRIAYHAIPTDRLIKKILEWYKRYSSL